ncbi:hypothetical protein [Vulgatibacter sp.]|uniref:hypothetical protein n=1 Tax=Vulgatibacter sp. TaxID=1971226 RepID=UPI003568F507
MRLRWLAGAALAGAVALVGCDQDEERRAEMARQQPLGNQVLQGEVLTRSADVVKIETSPGASLPLRVTEETEVIVGGERATLEQLERGREVRATFRYERGRPVAVRIEAPAP